MRFFKPPTFQVTPYGDVDAKTLETLRATYDTTELLVLVDRFDQLRRLFAAEGGIRDELLRLHAMTHTVINGAPLTVTPDNSDIWEVAQAFIDELSALTTFVQAAVEILQPIAALAPANE